jgi:hypothetical protein
MNLTHYGIGSDTSFFLLEKITGVRSVATSIEFCLAEQMSNNSFKPTPLRGAA